METAGTETVGGAEHGTYKGGDEQTTARSTRGERREHEHQGDLHRL